MLQPIASATALSQSIKGRDVIGMVFGLLGFTYWLVWRRAQFHQNDFVARMRAMLSATGARGSDLIFEVRGGLCIDQWQRVAARMTELAQMGIRFTIDDFATGYSSLAYLKKLPLLQGFFFARPMPLENWLEQRRLTMAANWSTQRIKA